MKKESAIRLGLLFVITVAFLLLVKHTALGDFFKFDQLKNAMLEAGITGILLFIAAFVAGTLLNIPGFLFIIVGLLVYGYALGLPVVYFGGLLSVVIHFLFIRSIGGKPLGEIQMPVIKKVMKRIDQNPVKTVALVRIFLFISPPANYTLALSNVTLANYVVGTMIGMIFPMTLLCALLYFAREAVIRWIQ